MKNDAGTSTAGKAWLKKARVKKLASGFAFTEGPVWHPDGYFLFSDTPANCIYQLFPNGSVQVYQHNSGLTHQHTETLSHQVGSNGLVLDANKNLYICQHGNHAIAVLNPAKEIRPLVGEYNGRPFNSPNDITISWEGNLYFTDPPYGLANEVLHPDTFQPHGGIYIYDFKTVQLIDTRLQYPNGIVFSPDQRYLYVGSNHPDEKMILRYEVGADGNMRYQDVFINENADGLTIDKAGNIYMATGAGILAVSPEGEKLSLTPLADTPSNLAWAPAEEWLLVTAGSSIYRIER